MSYPDPDHLVGEVGYVTTRIRGGDQPGEIQVALSGHSESFIAYADDPVEQGQQVLIIGRRPGRAFDVIFLAD